MVLGAEKKRSVLEYSLMIYDTSSVHNDVPDREPSILQFIFQLHARVSTERKRGSSSAAAKKTTKTRISRNLDSVIDTIHREVNVIASLNICI